MTEFVDESLGKMVMIESTKRMMQALEMLKRIKVWTWEDYNDFITVGVWQEDEMERFYAMSQAAIHKGFTSPYSGIANLEIELRKSVATSFHAVDHAGGITGLGSMVFIPDSGFRTFRLYDRNAPSILIANYLQEGNFGRISGVPGSGKTNTGCVISEEYAKLENSYAIGNIRMLKPSAHFLFCKNAKEFFTTISKLPDGARWLFTLDEAGLIYAKPDQTTRRVKDLDKLMRVVRHLKGSFNLIEQREDSVPTLIQEFAKNIFYCERKGVVSIELKGPDLAFRDTVKDFPKTTLPFDTYDIGYFGINVDIQKLLEEISGVEKPMQTLRAFMETEDAPRKEYMERVCKFPGCGKSLVGLGGNAIYCSSSEPPYHAQLDYQRKKRLGLDTAGKPKPSLQEFLE